jgi:arginine-tRNA-protein transferase
MFNHALVVASRELEFDAEHYDLYRRYQSMRHAGGGMDQDDSDQYSQFLLASQVKSNLLEFRHDGKLVMVSLIDQVQDGLSAVYTFFEPELSKRGLGTYSVIWLIEYARKLGLPYLYLGYWIKESRKMAYKSNFRPLEVLRDNEWTVL